MDSSRCSLSKHVLFFVKEQIINVFEVLEVIYENRLKRESCHPGQRTSRFRRWALEAHIFSLLQLPLPKDIAMVCAWGISNLLIKLNESTFAASTMWDPQSLVCPGGSDTIRCSPWHLRWAPEWVAWEWTWTALLTLHIHSRKAKDNSVSRLRCLSWLAEDGHAKLQLLPMPTSLLNNTTSSSWCRTASLQGVPGCTWVKRDSIAASSNLTLPRFLCCVDFDFIEFYYEITVK